MTSRDRTGHNSSDLGSVESWLVSAGRDRRHGSPLSFASGMAGIAAIFDQLHTGSVVALSDDCYQAVAGIAKAGQSRGRWTVHRVAVADTARWIEMCGVADLIWLESPSNPLLTVADLDA